ncbi:MAG: hypothetical protein H6838_05070 [Planctomycetes bacterium]|nr:hypothetical protein [Planctomycetota bacterium]
MKRRTEHLVEKRDGRTEYLRATKLARSIHLALHSVGVDEDWRALELANVALMALRQRHEGEAGDKQARAKAKSEAGAVATMLTTTEISEAVQHLLVVTGQPSAAVAYGAMAAERSRRRGTLALLGRSGMPAAAVDVTSNRQAGQRPRAE